MNCPNCNQANDNENIFCVSCGGNLAPPVNLQAKSEVAPTQFYNPVRANQPNDAPESVQTAFGNRQAFVPPTQTFNPSIPYPPTQNAAPKSNKFLWLGLGVLLLLLIGGGVAGFFLLNKPSPSNAEILPDHLGMFVQNKDKNNLIEISKQDSTNALQTKDDLLKNDSLPATDDKPNLILYADGKDVPVSDLKLVQIDSIKNDGTLKQINFQASPVDGKPEMKHLRVPDGLANGVYAFALLDGFLDEGKHKFWAFQVKNAAKSDNGDLAKAVTLSIKSKQSDTATNSNIGAANSNVAVKPVAAPKPETVAPAGAQVAYCNSNSVVVRNAPSLTARKISALRRGQKIYIINYSNNTNYWNGMEGNWAYIQTENGGRGWVFSPLLNN
ncbi:MAG: SH3 domain-containing protein [Pyrinomonadaceae bacterium]